MGPLNGRDPETRKIHQEPFGKIPLMIIPHAEVIVYSMEVEERKRTIDREHHSQGNWWILIYPCQTNSRH